MDDMDFVGIETANFNFNLKLNIKLTFNIVRVSRPSNMFPLLALLAATAALAAAPPPAQCAAITSRAPCGQPSDSASACATKGCCYDANGGNNSCFYAGGNAVPITTVHVIQACHFDAG